MTLDIRKSLMLESRAGEKPTGGKTLTLVSKKKRHNMEAEEVNKLIRRQPK